MLAKYSKHKSSSKKQYPTVIEELCHQFSLDDLMKATNNFDVDRIIRLEHSYKVYKGYVKHNGENDYPIALLRITNNKRYFKNEIELQCQLCHPNLISLIGFCDQKNEEILVYKEDEMVNGSLRDHLRSRDTESLLWKKRLEICVGAAKGLHYLHTGTKRPIFHRDIKPDNILLDNNMEPKLWQLGLSLQGKLSKSESIPIELDFIYGTWGFIAPEYWKTGTFTDRCDVYSFGMVLLQVILCKDDSYTFEERNGILCNPGNFLERFPADEIIDPILMRLIAPQCLAVFMNIMKRCLNSGEPNERPAMGEVEVELEHALALQEEADRETSNAKSPPSTMIAKGKPAHFATISLPSLSNSLQILNSAKGTEGFIAPEYWKTDTFTDKCDVYSFGMVLLQVILCINNFYTIRDKINMLEKRNGILKPNKRRLFNPADILNFPADEIIDPILMRLISPECLEVFMNIMKRCLNREEPNERPAMGEVEVELEHALALQEEADRETSNGDYKTS